MYFKQYKIIHVLVILHDSKILKVGPISTVACNQMLCLCSLTYTNQLIIGRFSKNGEFDWSFLFRDCMTRVVEVQPKFAVGFPQRTCFYN